VLKPCYPLDSDLAGGWRYPAFQQLGPDKLMSLFINCKPNFVTVNEIVDSGSL